MAEIESTYCIDKWEAMIIDKKTGNAASPHYIADPEQAQRQFERFRQLKIDLGGVEKQLAKIKLYRLQQNTPLSPQEIEEYLVSIGTNLTSDVLKAGHHGSKTSSAESFVSVVSPTYVIFSAGKDNSYGHPHKEVVDRFTAHGVILKNTADLGNIFSESDGVSIKFK